MKNDVTRSEDAGGPVAAVLNHRDSSWLDIDRFPDNHLGFEDSAAEEKFQKLGEIEDKSGPDGATDGQAKYGPQEMGYDVDGDGGHGDGGGVGHGRDDVTADPEMGGIEVDGNGSYSMDGHSARASGDGDGQ